MNSNKELPSWNRVFTLNRRAYALIYRRCPKMIHSRILCIIWDSLTPYISIYLSAQLINQLAGERDLGILSNLVWTILLVSALISLIASLFHKWRDTECAGLFYQLQQIFAEKMMDMDFGDADSSKTHELLHTIEQNRNGGGWGFKPVYTNLESILSALLTLFGGIAMTISLFTQSVPESSGDYVFLNHPLFIFLMIAVMLAVTLLAPYLSTKAGQYFARNSNTHNMANRLFGYFGFLGYEKKHASDVRIYRQDLFCDKYNSNKTDVFGSSGYFAKLCRGTVGFYRTASAAVSVVFSGVAYLFVSLKALGGAFPIGSVTQYIASITKVSSSVSSLILTLGGMRNNTPFLELIFTFLDIPNTMYQGSLTVEKRMDRNYEIEFRDVSFRYPGSDTFSLQHVNMKFHIGERLAVVGENGSGKTTFIKLLCRLYDPTEGEILLNGINIRKYDYREYMSIFSVVFQDFSLFAFPLGQNVSTSVQYDSAVASLCLEDAGFGERLARLPDGLETHLYKNLSKTGVEISGGEAQKIALARALYKDTPFIVLDEPTAALDPIAEAEVYSNFSKIVGDKTAVYISHRLSSCRFCDDVVVFDHGSIVQQGSHDVLVSHEDGKYYALWHAQAQYYQ